MQSRFLAVIIAMAVGLSGCAWAGSPLGDSAIEPTLPDPPEAVEIEPPAEVEVVVADPEAFDPTLYSVDEPSSLWVVVNKGRAFTVIDYAPDDLVTPELPSAFAPLLRRDAALALAEMFDAAAADGVGLMIQSSYRSYTLQVRVKAESVARWGQEISDARSARAGHSEHQTGLAVDLTTGNSQCTLEACFGETVEGKWLAENSWKFGFILRYLEGKTDVTGYIYEPWHFRFVGLELAEEIWLQGYPTLEEFFGLPPAPYYPD
jgi:D-alanyl-D-alanine carboxypeptidase